MTKKRAEEPSPLPAGSRTRRLLAENVDNNGSAMVTFPDSPTTQARIKIEAVNNIYFDISDQDFAIEVPDTPDFAVLVDPNTSEICTPNEAQFTIDVVPILGFSDPVDLSVTNLPLNAEATFSDNPVIPGNTTTLTISNTAAAATGEHVIELASSSGDLNKQNDIELTILSGNPPGPGLSFPVNAAIDVPLVPFLSWVEDPQMNTYTFELALDPDFNNIIDSVFDLTDAFYQVQKRLESRVTYYWRVIGVNNCGPGEYSETFSFTTLLVNYFTFESTDVPKTIDDQDPNTVVSTLEIEIVDNLIISDVNVVNLKGEHSFISDLKFTLRSPVGTEVVLFANICNNEENFDLSLDDESSNTDFMCPPTDGNFYKPSGSLSDFDGQNARGIWTLIVTDNATSDGGLLNSWGLEIGTNQSRPNPPANFQVQATSIDAITMTWEDASNNENSFIIERSGPDDSNFEEIANLEPNSQSFSDENLELETTYIYRIKATNSFGDSQYSEEIETATLPIAPDNLLATAVSGSQIDLTWSDLSGIEDNYAIEMSVSDNQDFVVVANIDPNSESYSVEDLQEATTYYFRIYAQNQYGRSSFSQEVNATTLVVGIADEIAGNISVFPNPTKGDIIIEVEKEDLTISGIRLADIQGKTIRILSRDDIRLQQRQFILAINADTKGMYLLEIITDQATVVKRIIKSQ